MDGVVVKRSHGGDGGDSKYYLSVLSPDDFSLSENHNLPFFEKNDAIEGNSCRGLLYFHEYEGKAKSVICKLTTKELKFLPPPKLEPPPNFALFTGIGLGYDSKSHDYKVIRNFAQYYSEKDEDGRSLYRGYKTKTELYSLKTGSWKEIPNPDASICEMSGVYIKGKCYWTATLGHTLGGSTWLGGVLSFDFIDESFSSFSLPPIKEDSNIIYRIVAFHGSVGAIGYPRPGVSKSPKRSRVSSKSFEVWVWREMSWAKVYTVALRHIGRPLGLKDGRFLFLEAKHRGRLSQLAVYDLLTNVRKKLKIYDYPGMMKVFSYAHMIDPLPDAEPLDGSHTKDEEDKEATGARTRTMTRMRKKEGKRTRTRTRTRTGNVEELSRDEKDDSNNEPRPKKRRRLASSH